MVADRRSERLRLAVIGATYATLEPRKKIEALAAHFDLTCITGTGYNWYGQENDLSKQPVPTNYRLIGLPYRGRPQTSTRYMLRGLGAELSRGVYDIILVESEPWAFLRWQTWFWKSRRQPRALFGEFTWENVERGELKGRVLSIAYRAAAMTADFVIAGNRKAGEIVARHGVKANRILVSPQLGVDAELFQPPSAERRTVLRSGLGIPDDAFLVGFCGRLEETKGVEDLLSAVRRARESLPMRNIHLVVKGGGRLATEIEKLRQTENWLHIEGVSFHHEVAGYMQALDLFVLPSRDLRSNGEYWSEQFGHVLIEAMACGVPTIGSDCGAIPEVIGDANCIFAQRDVDALTGLMIRIAGESGLAAWLAERGRSRVLQNYTNRVIARQWAEFMIDQHCNSREASPAR